MDAKKLGGFIAEQRKERKMTQADLAGKLHVTDKAVSKWERGVGLPDINTIEPLANALGVSVLEVMKAEKITTPTIANEDASAALTDTFALVRQQRRMERRNAAKIFIIVVGLLLLVFLIDTMSWEGFLGVYLPVIFLMAGVALLIYGIWRKKNQLPCLQTFIMAILMLLIPIALIVFLFAAGMSGIFPTPS